MSHIQAMRCVCVVTLLAQHKGWATVRHLNTHVAGMAVDSVVLGLRTEGSGGSKKNPSAANNTSARDSGGGEILFPSISVILRYLHQASRKNGESLQESRILWKQSATSAHLFCATGGSTLHLSRFGRTACTVADSMDTWHKLKYVSHQCVQQTCGSGKRDDTRNQNCAQDSHPALCWRHFGSAPISLTALQKSVRGSWVDAHMWCPGFVSLPQLAEWTQCFRIVFTRELACAFLP